MAPPALGPDEQAQLKAAVQASPRDAGINLAKWNWKVVREFVRRRFGRALSRSSCRNYLRRLGFVLKRPMKRLLKADAARRAAFVREYAIVRAGAAATGAKICFADEAIWGWVREEVTANTCFATRARVRDVVGQFFRALPGRVEEVKRRCRTVLQAEADALAREAAMLLPHPHHADPTLALV